MVLGTGGRTAHGFVRPDGAQVDEGGAVGHEGWLRVRSGGAKRLSGPPGIAWPYRPAQRAAPRRRVGRGRGALRQVAPQHEVLHWIAKQMGEDVAEQMPPVAGGKRMSNQRMLATGFELRYPDYKAGYADLLQSV